MKKLIYVLIFSLLIFYMILHPAEACEASENGILLWFTQVLPALLPFTMISAMIMRSGLLAYFEEHLPAPAARLGAGRLYIIFCGFLFGFPIGSKLACDCCLSGLISKRDAEILCCFTNNLSPAFILSYVLNTRLHHAYPASITLAILYLPPFCIGCLLLFGASAKKQKKSMKKTSRFQLDMQIVDAGIISGFETLIKLCGYIVFFSMLGSIVNTISLLPSAVRLFLCASLEVTNGTAIIADSTLSSAAKYITCVGLLATGGLSGLAQTASMLAPADLSLNSYIKMKLLFTTCSLLSAAVFCLLFI